MTKNIDAPVVSIEEMKLRLFRIIDRLPALQVQKLYESFDADEVVDDDDSLAAFVSSEDYNGPVMFEGDIDEGYAEMFADEEREKEAREWIEGTLNHKELTSGDL